MNHTDIWDAVRRRWLVAVLFALLGGAVAYGYHQVVPARYTSAAEVMVTPADGQSVDQLSSTIAATMLQANNLKASATTDAVLVPVVERLGLNEDVADLASRVEATIAPNTSVISVTVRGVNAAETAAIANAIAEQMQTDLSSLAPKDGAGFTTVQIRSVTEAKIAIAADSFGLPVLLVMGFAGGAVAGVFLAVAISQATVTRAVGSSRPESSVNPQRAQLPV